MDCGCPSGTMGICGPLVEQMNQLCRTHGLDFQVDSPLSLRQFGALRETFTVEVSLTLPVPKKEKMGCNVFVGVMPIRLPPFSPSPLAPALARAGVLHFYTVIEQPSPVTAPYVYFDFLPENPEDPLLAFGALLGQKVPGIVHERNLRKLPGKSCWLIGKTGEDMGLESVREFNTCWDNRLLLFQHDCRHYTDALMDHLIGKSGVIEQVIELNRNDVDPAQRFIDNQ